MCETREFLRDRLYTRGVDVLSDVLTVMRAGRPVSALVGWRGAWAQDFAPVPGAVGARVVVRGSCVLIPAGAAPIHLTAGDVVLLPHGRGHVLADSPDTVSAAAPCDPRAERRPDVPDPDTLTLCGAYELAPEGGHPLLRELPEVVHLSADGELKTAVTLLATELSQPGLGADALVPTLLDLLLLYTLRTWFASHPERGWAAALRDPVVAPALGAVHEDPAKPWTVASLAALGGLSRAPFARRFAELVGQSPMRYVTWWRMTTAARLLRSSDAALHAVAAEVGYQSEFAFATAFKRQYGVAPGRYRKDS